MRFLDDEIFASQDHIDPGNIVPHDWKKLQLIWKGINKEYKAALSQFTVSGTHNSNFCSFCNGKLDVYYLKKNLELHPQLNDMVEADLPTECALSSDMALSDLEVKSNNDGSTKRKCSPNHEVAKAICDLANSCMGSELAKQHLLYMEREDTQRQEERKEQSHKN